MLLRMKSSRSYSYFYFIWNQTVVGIGWLIKSSLTKSLDYVNCSENVPNLLLERLSEFLSSSSEMICFIFKHGIKSSLYTAELQDPKNVMHQ